MNVALVSDIENEVVTRAVEHPVHRHGQLHHAEIGGEMPAGLGYRPHQKLPYLRGKVIELIFRNAPEILYAFDAVNVIGFHYIP